MSDQNADEGYVRFTSSGIYVDLDRYLRTPEGQEAIRRTAAAGRATRTDADALAHKIAEEAALDRFNQIMIGRDRWTLIELHKEDVIAYLTARGLLEQHPERPELVRVRADG